MIELVAIAVLIGGSALVLRAGVTGWVVPPLGYIAGTCLLIDFAFLQIIFGLPTTPILSLALIVMAPLCWWLSERDRRLGLGPLQISAAMLGVICLVYVFRNVNFLSWSQDTLRYLTTGALIASNNFDAVTPKLLAARLLAFPILHAPANIAGEFYMRSVGPLLAISGIALFVWLSLNGSSASQKYRLLALTALGALFLTTNDRMIWSVFALYPHLLVAVLVLLIAGLGWLSAVSSDTTTSNAIDRNRLIVLQSIAIPALVIARPEGSMLAAIAVLPTILCREVALKPRAFLLCVLGLSIAAWNLLLLAHMTHLEVSLSIIGPLAIAVIALVAALLLFSQQAGVVMTFLEERRSLILVLFEVTLWMLLVSAAIWNPKTLLTSVSATKHNLLYGAGGWGYSLVVLGILVLVCAVAACGKHLVFIRFPVTSFVPLAFLLAYLRDLPYRVGYGDSLNRMWIHILPLAVLFVVAALSSNRWRWSMASAALRTLRPRQAGL